MQKLKQVPFILMIAVIVLALLPARGYAAPPTMPPPRQGGGLTTPFQEAVDASINQRQAAGLPVPTVTTEQEVVTSPTLSSADGPSAFSAMAAPASGSDGSYLVVTTTTLHFDGPQEAGYDTWPRWIIDENYARGTNGTVNVGDYTEIYRAAIDGQYPGFWNYVEFGQEPREYTFTETIGYSAPPGVMAAMLSADTVETTEGVLMGLTYTGVDLDYTLSADLCTGEVMILGVPFKLCAGWFRVGFQATWGFGLRLPVDVTLTGPATVSDGEYYRPSAVLTPLDWSAADYANAGVAEEDGKEYFLRFIFFVGLEGALGGIPLCDNCNVSVEIDESQDFATPLGTTFPLGMVQIPAYEFEPDPAIFGGSIGVGVTPEIGSDQITADWRALPGSDATGSGSVAFTAPGTPVELATVLAVDQASSDTAVVEMSNFQYWINLFKVTVSAYLEFELFGNDPWLLSYPLYTFDLSTIMGDGMALGAHTQCDWAFNCTLLGPDNVLLLSSLLQRPTAGSASVAPPPVPMCADFNGSTTETIRAYVPDGTVTKGSVFCRSLVENTVFVQNSAEIGKPEILQREVIQAVDVFALFHDGTPTAIFNYSPTVCLKGSGALFYLDATVSPRTVVELPAFAQSGYTCGSIPNAGTVVLVGGSPSVTAPAASAGSTALSGCMVTTNYLLNLRENSSGQSAVIVQVPYNVTLTATERQNGWFHVDYLGTAGWLNAAYVAPSAGCQ